MLTTIKSFKEDHIINGSVNCHYNLNDFNELNDNQKKDWLWFSMVGLDLVADVENELKPENFEMYFNQVKATPQKREDKTEFKIGKVTLTSSAQLMTLTGYGDTESGRLAGMPFRNLDYNVECSGVEDLKKCVKIIDGYNEFDQAKICHALNFSFNLKEFYGETNPNNGNDLLGYHIARESSPAIYITCMLSSWKKSINIIQDREGATVYVEQYTREEIIQILKAAASDFERMTKADVCRITEKENHIQVKYWWD